jgi:hypothetical protein
MLANVIGQPCQIAADGGSATGLEENNLNTFVSTVTGNAAFNTSDWVVPVSVGSEIGQHNGYGLDRSSTGLAVANTGIGDIGNVGTGAFDISGTTWSPDHTYYGGQFGRYLFVVLPSTLLSGGTRDKKLINLFDGATSQVCSASTVATSALFGFDQQYSNTDGQTGESGGACGVILGTSNN